MKKTIIYSALFFLFSTTLFFSSCKKDNPEPAPIANFSISGDNNFAPSKVSFLNTSTNAVSFIWDFGDGQTSTVESPSHLYADGGTFNVTLTVKNSDGLQNIINKTATIKDVPSKLKITSMIVNAMPFLDESGASWDITDGPDVFFLFTDDGFTSYFETGVYNDVVSGNLPLTYSNGFPLTLINLDYEFQIHCYDYDLLDDDDFIGGYYFTIRDEMPTNGDPYPSTIIFQNATYQLNFTLNVEWVQ
jgi:PKD repeat protein